MVYKSDSLMIIDKIRKATKNKEGKTLIANFGYLTALQVAGYIFPLLTMPYLARVIGVSGFGKIAFAGSVIIWIQTITDWGFNFTATRDVAQCRSDSDKVSMIFSNVFWTRIFLCSIAFLILLALVSFIPIFAEYRSIILITFLTVPGHILFPEWFFQALERMRYITIFNIVIKFIFTVAVFVFIQNKDDYLLQPVLTTIGYLVCGTCTFYIIICRWGYKLHKPNFKTIRKAIKDGTDVFLNTIFPNLYSNFSLLLLGLFGSPIHNGIFDGGNKFVAILYQLEMVLSRTFFPFLSRKNEKHYIFARINLSIAIIANILLFVFAPLIVSLFLGKEFSSSVIVMRILSFSFVGLALSNTYGTNYLIIKHRDREIRNITIISSILGMIFAVPLVYYYNFIGASLTILFSRSLIGLLTYIRVKKHP